MKLRNWNDIPDFMRISEVRPYYDILKAKRTCLWLKRAFDVIMATVLLLFFAFPMIIISLLIKLDSPGPVMFRQERITMYGKRFKIHKFRSMISNADKLGTIVTVSNDSRITRMGRFLRTYRLDEIPQLIDVLVGDMSFVGTRPEVPKYVEQYEPEFFATLLLPAGITSEASIRYKDEYKLLHISKVADQMYMEKILPQKMKWNLESIRYFSFLREMNTCLHTVLIFFGKNIDFNK